MKDVVCVCVWWGGGRYVRPEGCPFYPFVRVCCCCCGPWYLFNEGCLTDDTLTLDSIYVILSGNLNCRSASNSKVVSMNDDVFGSLQARRPVNVNRNSQNNALNNYEKPCLLYTSPSPRDSGISRMPSSA